MKYESEHDVCRGHLRYETRHAARLAKKGYTRYLKRVGEWRIDQCLSVFRCRVDVTDLHYHIGRRQKEGNRGRAA